MEDNYLNALAECDDAHDVIEQIYGLLESKGHLSVELHDLLNGLDECIAAIERNINVI